MILVNLGFSLLIAIPTCNRVHLLSNLLQKLTLQVSQFSTAQIKILVSDDDPNFTSFQLSNYFPNVSFQQGLNRGLTANRNSIFLNTKADWILFIDDDCIPSTNWLKSYLNAINQYQNVGFFSGPVLQEHPKKRMDEEAPYLDYGSVGFHGCNYLIKTSLLADIGGFNLKYSFYLEDVELFLRLQRRKIQLVFCNSAVVFHPWRIIPSISGKSREFLTYIYLISDYPELLRDYLPLPRFKIFISKLYYFLRDIFIFKANGIMKALSILIIDFSKTFFYPLFFSLNYFAF